ncbi:hypothetical protein [Streptomyces sp. HUAS ZL42]
MAAAHGDAHRAAADQSLAAGGGACRTQAAVFAYESGLVRPSGY